MGTVGKSINLCLGNGRKGKEHKRQGVQLVKGKKVDKDYSVKPSSFVPTFYNTLIHEVHVKSFTVEKEIGLSVCKTVV